MFRKVAAALTLGVIFVGFIVKWLFLAVITLYCYTKYFSLLYSRIDFVLQKNYC